MKIENQAVPTLEEWPEETIMILRTMFALSSDGKQVDNYELADALVADYGWTHDYAFDLLEFMESEGMIFPGPASGEMLQ